MVTLQVKNDGDDLAKFLVHSKVICNASPVFKAAFQGAFKEGEWKTLELKETTCLAVNDFIFWLYRGVCPSPPEEDNEYLLRYATLYTFAERYEILKMKHDALAAAVHRASEDGFTHVDVFTTKYVYENTVPGDGFRRLLVCICAYNVAPVYFENKKMEEYYRESPSEFVLDSVMEMGRNNFVPKDSIIIEGVNFYEAKIQEWH